MLLNAQEFEYLDLHVSPITRDAQFLLEKLEERLRILRILLGLKVVQADLWLMDRYPVYY